MDRRPPAHRHHRIAFTLVELLVVIAIILTLLAILLPSLSRALSAANRAGCTSNLRQIMIAVPTYTADSLGILPYTGRDAPHMSVLDIFEVLLAPSFKDRDALHCPNDSQAPGYWAAWWRTNINAAGITLADHAASAQANPEIQTTPNVNYSYWWSAKMYTAVNPATGYTTPGTLAPYSMSQVRHGGRLIAAYCGGESPNVDTYLGNTTRVNGGFMDGHAASYAWTDIRTPAPGYTYSNGTKHLDHTVDGVGGYDIN